MKKTYRISILTIVLISVCLFPTLNSVQSSYTNQDINIYDEAVVVDQDFSEEEIKISEPELIDTTYLNRDFKSLGFDIFGYSLKVEALNPIDSDEFGEIIIFREENKKNFLNIELKLESGDYSFSDIRVKGESYVDLDKNQLYRYNIENPILGFFMDIDIYPKITKISLAFDGGDQQLCYEGFINEGFSTYNAYLTSEISAYSVESKEACLSPKSDLSFIDQKEKMMSDNLNKLEIASNPDSADQPKSAGIITTKYGMVHNVCFYQDDEDGTDYISEGPTAFYPYYEIKDGMLESPSIQYVIERNEPTETTIKSDLQYYNKDYYSTSYNTGYKRNVLAYTIYAHGPWPSGGYYKMNEFLGRLSGYEISNLWYTKWQGEYYEDVRPTNMIILSKSCFNGISGMADAFLNSGASTYCGPAPFYTDRPGTYMDLYYNPQRSKWGFWGSLCNQGSTVQVAVENLIYFHNLIPEYTPWTLGVSYKLYGSGSTTL